MVLESDVNCLSKAIHVINFDLKKDYMVGRRINNDVTVSDISVSRAQAAIKLRGEKVYVQDKDSKFGTFIKIMGLYTIDKNMDFTIPIQVEKKCFFIKLQKIISFWHLCFCPGFRVQRKKSKKGETIYDHFEDVTEKYPKEIYKIVMPDKYY